VRFPLRFVLMWLVPLGIAVPAFAQAPWTVLAGVGAAGFSGGSEALDPPPGEPTHYKPAPTTRLHFGVTREFGRGGITLDASYAKAGLGGYGGNINFTFSPVLTLYDLRLLGGLAVARIGEGSIRLGAGPMLQIWSGDALLSTQTRLGGVVALSIVVPATRTLGLLLSGSLGVTSSPFDQSTLSESNLAGLATWTRELAVGVRLSL
jgi:hypothetical protein